MSPFEKGGFYAGRDFVVLVFMFMRMCVECVSVCVCVCLCLYYNLVFTEYFFIVFKCVFVQFCCCFCLLLNGYKLYYIQSRERHQAGRATGPRLAIVCRERFSAPCSRFPPTLCRTVAALRHQTEIWQSPIQRRTPIRTPTSVDYLTKIKEKKNRTNIDQIHINRFLYCFNFLPRFSSAAKHTGYKINAISTDITMVCQKRNINFKRQIDLLIIKTRFVLSKQKI